jgi:AraC-like DNA-binding protein
MTDLNRIVEFSTSAIPEKDRIAVWREHYGQMMFRVDLEPAGDRSFEAKFSTMALPGLQLVDGTSSPVRISRRGVYLADGNDDILLCYNRSGSVTVTSGGREQDLREGEAVVLSGGEEAAFHRKSVGQSYTMRVPRPLFESSVISVGDVVMRPIPVDRGALRLLSSYTGWLFKAAGAGIDQALMNLSVRHVHDLLALAVGPSPDFADTARTRGLRAVRLKLAKSHVVANSHNRELSVVSLAASLNVTPRYLQRLFEADGTTFSDYLLGQRLARAHRLLCEPGADHRAISTIAYDVGFGDLSYFNRRFRRQYGLTPREVRGDRT